jgi:hypothetical protein
MERVLLINPAETPPAWPTMPRAVEPMGLLYVAGAFNLAGVEITPVDLQLGYGDLEMAYQDIMRGSFGGVGIALGSQACLWSALEIARQVKKLHPAVPVFTGGVFASLNAEWLLKTTGAFDFVVIGEAEPFVFEFVERQGRWQGLPTVQDRTPGAQQPALPVPVFAAAPLDSPDRSLTRTVIDRGETPSVVASRGCGGGCSFCCISRYYGSKWQPRDIQAICRELEALAERFSVRRFHLVDDNLFGHARGSREWAMPFLQALTRFDPPLSFKTTCRLDDLDETLIPMLRPAGFDLLKIGVETFSQQTQRVYGKPISRQTAAGKLDRLREAGVGVSLGFIMFDPYCGVADLHKNLDFLLEYPDFWSRHLLRSKLIAYRGTRIEKLLERHGLATSKSIKGTQWRFRDPGVAEVHRRFERLLRTEILDIELKLYYHQPAAIRAGQTPARLGELVTLLQTCWIDLFSHALENKPLTARTQRHLSLVRTGMSEFCDKELL